MAHITIGGVEHHAVFNLRAARLFEERSGRKLAAVLSDAFGGDFEGLDAVTVTAAVWALANSKRGAEVDYEEVEESIDLAAMPQAISELLDLLAASLEEVQSAGSPLSKTAEAFRERIAALQNGSASGPSASADSESPAATPSPQNSGTSRPHSTRRSRATTSENRPQ